MSRRNPARGQTQADSDEGGSQQSQTPQRQTRTVGRGAQALQQAQPAQRQAQQGQANLARDPRPEIHKDEHRLLLQLFWARRVIEEEELRGLVEAIRRELKLTYQPTVEEMTQTINKSLESLKFTLRKTKRESDGAILYGIVNTAADDISKTGSTFVPNQLIFFKHLIKVLATEHKDDGRIKREDAVALHNSVEDEDKDGAKTKVALAAKAVDDYVTQFVAEGWLDESKTENRYLTLTARTFLELKPLFEEPEYAGFNCGFL